MEYREYLIGLGLSTTTVKAYGHYLDRAKRWAHEHGADLLALTPSQARTLGDTFPKTHASRRPLRVALRHFWTMHGTTGPEQAIIVPKRPRGVFRGMTDTAAAALLEAARTDWPRGAAVYVGVYQGLRRETIASLRWGDFDEPMEWLTVLTKGNTTHRLPVHPRVRTALLPHRWPGEWVFPGRFGGHVTPATINNWIVSLAKEAGVGHLTPHQMRHTAGGKVYRETGNIYLAAAWLGHAHISTTQIYTEVDDAMLASAMDALDWEDTEAA